MWAKFLGALERFAGQPKCSVVVGRGARIFLDRMAQNIKKEGREAEDMESEDKGDNR